MEPTASKRRSVKIDFFPDLNAMNEGQHIVFIDKDKPEPGVLFFGKLLKKNHDSWKAQELSILRYLSSYDFYFDSPVKINIAIIPMSDKGYLPVTKGCIGDAYVGQWLIYKLWLCKKTGEKQIAPVGWEKTKYHSVQPEEQVLIIEDPSETIITEV